MTTARVRELPGFELSPNRRQFEYQWPAESLRTVPGWSTDAHWQTMTLRESAESLAEDSRWPSFFPSPISLVTTGDHAREAFMEKVVGASIVNRFPYIMAISFCREELSGRHYSRTRFCEELERTGTASVQFLVPGEELAAAMRCVVDVPDKECHRRIEAANLGTRPAHSHSGANLSAAYLVYEGKLVEPAKDFSGDAIFARPYRDIGSHRIYFLEVRAVQLREDIAMGQSQVHWRSLPAWGRAGDPAGLHSMDAAEISGYQKGYSPAYSFPAKNTIAFEYDTIRDGMAIKELPPVPEDQVEVDNHRARWPCFFPQSAGMITSWTEEGAPNIMPCGSTTVVSRRPFTISPCLSYAGINERYAPRASLNLIRRSGYFGCGVPYIDEPILDALRYLGNVSMKKDADKVLHSGLDIERRGRTPLISALPVHFECKVIGEEALGTHIMFFGEVERIFVRNDVSPDNPLGWCPWADVY